jgi:hypothetical protein
MLSRLLTLWLAGFRYWRNRIGGTWYLVADPMMIDYWTQERPPTEQIVRKERYSH